MVFIVLFGIVSLFSDMTHEGASSIRGAYMSLLGASAATIGFISGLGELIGYSLRYVFGKLTDKTKQYWPMTLFGYALDILAVPALALVGEHGWIAACILLVIQRMGKAIKKPAKDTIMSFAASQEGVGKSFGIQEVLDRFNDINENNRTKPSSEKIKVLNPWRLDIHAGISISYFELGIYGNPLPTYRAGVGGKPRREFGFYLKW